MFQRAVILTLITYKLNYKFYIIQFIGKVRHNNILDCFIKIIDLKKYFYI